MPQFTTYVAPEFTEGDSYKPIDHLKRTIVVKVLEHKTGIITSNSPDGGPGVIVDLVDIAEDKVYRNVLWMSGAIVDGLKDHAASPSLLVIHFESTKGKSGRTYPIIQAADAAELKVARDYFASHSDPFAPQLSTVGDDEPPF